VSFSDICHVSRHSDMSAQGYVSVSDHVIVSYYNYAEAKVHYSYIRSLLKSAVNNQYIKNNDSKNKS